MLQVTAALEQYLIHLDGPFHVGLLPPQVEQAHDREHDEAGLDEGGVVDQDVDVAGAQVDQGKSALEKVPSKGIITNVIDINVTFT